MYAVRLMLLVAALGVSGASFAGPEAAALSKLEAAKGKLSAGEEKALEARFKAADKDGDGSLTLEEAKAGMPLVAAKFDEIDTDKKGTITLDQIKAAQAGAPAAAKAKLTGALGAKAPAAADTK